MIARFYKSATETAGRSIAQAANTLLPPRCPVTFEEVESNGFLSCAAWQNLQFIEAPFCRGCGIPFKVDYGGDIECPSCIADQPKFDEARAAVVYDDTSHKLIVGFKHSDRTDLAPMFASWMARAGAGFFSRDTAVVPVPLHPRRMFARKYNQSALLSKQLGKITGARVMLDGLRRIRHTPPQQSLSAEARKRNVQGAFRLGRPAGEIEGKSVVLIDDVLTTGATLSAAATALKRAGASRVSALVIARVVKGGFGAI